MRKGATGTAQTKFNEQMEGSAETVAFGIGQILAGRDLVPAYCSKCLAEYGRTWLSCRCPTALEQPVFRRGRARHAGPRRRCRNLLRAPASSYGEKAGGTVGGKEGVGWFRSGFGVLRVVSTRPGYR